MPTLGRNEPCPCGSGRKYKSCCLIHDRIAEQRDLNLTPAEARLLTFIYNYARQPRFNQDVIEGFNLYWGGVFDPAAANAVGPENMRRFFEWFVHDYPTRPDKQYIVDLFHVAAADRLSEEERALLEAWRNSTLGLFRVVGFQADDLLLYDPLRESELGVRDGVYARSASIGDVLIGRLYRVGEVNLLSHMTMALPAPFEESLVSFLKNAYTTYGTDQGETASWEQFLRVRATLISAWLLSERASNLRKLIGPGTPYANPALGREKLVAESTRLRAEQQKEAAQKQGQPAVRRTAGGIILPGAPEPAAQTAPPSSEQAPKPRILIPGRDS